MKGKSKNTETEKYETEKYDINKFKTLSDIIHYIESTKDCLNGYGYQMNLREFAELMIQALKIIQNFNIIISDLKHNQEGLIEHLKWLSTHLDSIEESNKIIKDCVEESLKLLEGVREFIEKLPDD